MFTLTIRPNRPTRTCPALPDGKPFILRAGDVWQLTEAEAKHVEAWAKGEGVAADYAIKAQARAPRAPAAAPGSPSPKRAPRGT